MNLVGRAFKITAIAGFALLIGLVFLIPALLGRPGSVGGGDAFAATNAGGTVTVDGWARPGEGALTSKFGSRIDPTYGTPGYHYGIDISGGCDAAIWAANDGEVIRATNSFGGYGGTIDIDHGGGVVTRYGHMWPDGILVDQGDRVTAGQRIGDQGNAGKSTGCHVHFEVRIDNRAIDPIPFLSARGITF